MIELVRHKCPEHGPILEASRNATVWHNVRRDGDSCGRRCVPETSIEVLAREVRQTAQAVLPPVRRQGGTRGRRAS